MEFQANEVKAGAIILTGFVLLVVFLVLIFGIDVGEASKEYTTKLNYVGGIAVGSLVKFGGMDVGHVTNISFDPNQPEKILLSLKVSESTPIKTDSKAYVTSIGIMANQHIEISAGSPEAMLLPTGSDLGSKEVLSFTQMAEPLGELSTKSQELMDKFGALFDEENQAHITSMLENLDKMMSDGSTQFVSLMDNLQGLTSNLDNLSKEINDLMTGNKDNFDQTFTHLETTMQETSELISDLRKSLQQVDNMMSANSTSIVEIMENFQYASQNFEEFSRIVKERPWLLVRKDAPPERKMP